MTRIEALAGSGTRCATWCFGLVLLLTRPCAWASGADVNGRDSLPGLQEGAPEAAGLDVRDYGRRLARAVKAEDFAAAEALVRELGDPPPVGSRRDMERLVEALEQGLRARSEDANAAFQQATLLALGCCGPEGGKALDRALRNHGLRSRLVVHATILRAMGSTREPKRLPQLVNAVSPFTPEISIAAIQGLTDLIKSTQTPLADRERAAKAVERCHRQLLARTLESGSYPPPPAFGDPLPWPSRERVLACLPSFAAARNALVVAIRERE